MNTAHTPGPWNVESEWNDGDHFAITAPTSRTSMNERGIVANFQHTPFIEQVETNARLIAAAPELLEALEVLEHAASFAGIPERDEHYAVGKALLLARAAIAKAKGS